MEDELSNANQYNREKYNVFLRNLFSDWLRISTMKKLRFIIVWIKVHY